MISFNTVKNFVNACLPTALTTMGVIGICVFGYSVKKGTENISQQRRSTKKSLLTLKKQK